MVDAYDSGKNRTNENFPVGSFLLRPELRPHVFAFYNFARAADDISDHPLLEPSKKVERLERFAVTLLDDNNSDVLPAIELRKSLRQTGITPQHALDLLTAFKRDATQLRYRDWYDLIDYCNYSAAPVGRYMLALHGTGKEAWAANDALCNALQIINHIQDCADDFMELDRVYIPQDIMTANGIGVDCLGDASSSPGLRRTLDAILARLEPMMKMAWTFPPQIADKRLRAETAVICALADRLVKLLKKRDPLCDDVKLGKSSIVYATIVGVLKAWA